jgi:hypothetical protein
MPLAAIPEWMREQEPETPRSTTRNASAPTGKLSPYCEAALRNAYQRIVEAPAGQQETTLNGEAFGLAILVTTRAMPAGLALDVLQRAALKMPNYTRRRPWRHKELDRKVKDAFTAPLRHRWEAPRD